MAKNFNPADVASVKTNFNVAPAYNAEGLAFLVRRSKRRMRRENRAI